MWEFIPLALIASGALTVWFRAKNRKGEAKVYARVIAVGILLAVVMCSAKLAEEKYGIHTYLFDK